MEPITPSFTIKDELSGNYVIGDIVHCTTDSKMYVATTTTSTADFSQANAWSAIEAEDYSPYTDDSAIFRIDGEEFSGRDMKRMIKIMKEEHPEVFI